MRPSSQTKRILLMMVLACAPLCAQRMVPASKIMTVEYEDERLRVIRVTLAPGESTGTQEMNERINVCATDGKIRISFDGKDLGVFDVKAGTVRHESAARFVIENVGTSEFQTVITEFKGQFAKSTVVPSVATSPSVEKPQTAESSAVPMSVTPQPTASQPVIPPAVTSNTGAQSPLPQKPVEPPVQSAPAATPESTNLNVDGAKVLFVNGTELAYIERGQGQPVVLVHDTLGDYRSWGPQLTALSRSYRVIAYSRRYHYPNHSNGKERDYSYDINVKDLADFIRALNAGPVRLVGFGYGATIVGMVAAEHPELVKALVVTEPAYEQLLDKTMAFRSQFAREEIYGDIRKPLTKEKSEKGVQIYVDWLGYQNWAAISTEEQFRKKQNANALHAQTFDPSPPNFNCATAKKITAPTLILSGQKRSPNSAEIAGVLSGCIQNAERASVPNAGGAVYIDNPSEANKMLAEFLGKP